MDSKYSSVFSTLSSILLNSEEVDEPPVAASVLLDVAVLLHDLRVLLGHHVDHNATGLAQPGHRGKAGERNVTSSKAAHHDDAVIGAAEQLAGHLRPEGALDHLVVDRPLLVRLLLGAVKHLPAEVETGHISESSLGKSSTNCSRATGHVQHFQLGDVILATS